jgi:hypothetical protein
MENKMHILSCCFKKLCFRTSAEPAASADPQSIENTGGEPDKPQSSLHKLAASNPHVIATSLFSGKRRK